MKKKVSPASGKILAHDQGTGLLTAKELKTRAREIALINGHSTPTDDDRDQAKHDLQGDSLPPTSDTEDTSNHALTRDPSEPVSNYGSQTPTPETEDEQNSSERMVVEGVEEAQHDQMLAARRQHK